jgi:hypothetical protein
MNSKTGAIAGAVGLVAVVLVVSVLVLGEEPTATKVGTTSSQTSATDPDGTTERTPTTSARPPRTATTSLPTPTATGDRTTPTPTTTSSSGPGPRPSTTEREPAPSGPVQVTFRCSDEGGERLAGVFIEVRRKGGAPAGTLTSDGQGQASLGGLPAGEAIEGVARHPLSNQPVSFGPITLRGGSVVDLKFRRSQTGTLRGKVLDERGAVVLDASLRLIDPKQSGEAVLDRVGMALSTDGTFLATVAAGTYAVSAEAPNFSPSDRTYVTVPPGGEAGPVELTLHRQGAISGKVTLPPDLAAALPAPVDLVLEVTRGTAENPYQRVIRKPLEIDPTFAFVVEGCDPGRYQLRLEVPAAGGNRVGPWYALSLEPGQRIDGVMLVLKDVPPAVRGVVRDDRSIPIEGATIVVRGRQSVTDRDGRYAVHGLAQDEDVLIEARADRHAPATQQATYEGTELVIDLVLSRFGGVRGRVRGRGGPAGNVPVLVCQRSDDGGVRPYQLAAGADGGYLLENLPPGTYYVKAGAGANAFDPTGAPTVEVRPGEVVEAPDVTLP